MSLSHRHITLLEKLSKGTITSEEKWLLEKASLDDPFLAEALEGYYNYGSTKKKSRVIPFGKNWVLAASLILLFGVSFLFLQQMNSSKKNQEKLVSMNAVEEEDQEMVSLSNEDGEVVAITEKEPEIPESPRKIQANKTSIQERKRPNRQTEQNMGAVVVEESMDLDQEMVADAAPIQVSPLKSKAVQNIKSVSGQVFTIDGVPLSGAELSTPAKDIVVQTDSRGQFTMNLRPDDSLIVASFAGYDSQVIHPQPSMAIELVRARDALSAPMKTKKQLMSDSELKLFYKDYLDDIFAEANLDCGNLSDNGIRRINVQVFISSDSRISRIEFLNEVPQDCSLGIEEEIRQLEVKEVITEERPMNFNYSVRIK